MNSYEIVVAPKKENIEYVDNQLSKLLASWNIPNQDRIHFAIHELFINALQAGEQSVEVHKDINIIMTNKDNMIVCEVRDYFGGMDPIDIQKEVDCYKESGRGFFIINHLVDQIDFTYAEDGCFIVRIEISY